MIAGGYDKGLDYRELGQIIQASPHIIGLVIIGQVAQTLSRAVGKYKGKIAAGARDLNEAVAQANRLAVMGSTVLFSPGAASFDMFKNETDRGEQFIKCVNNLP